MRAKPDLVPDCDVHGRAMRREEWPAAALGMNGNRDVLAWCCTLDGCGRFFHGAVGYQYRPPRAQEGLPTPRCDREGAFLVAQRDLESYICPVDGCYGAQLWEPADTPAKTGTPMAHAAAR